LVIGHAERLELCCMNWHKEYFHVMNMIKIRFDLKI